MYTSGTHAITTNKIKTLKTSIYFSFDNKYTLKMTDNGRRHINQTDCYKVFLEKVERNLSIIGRNISTDSMEISTKKSKRKTGEYSKAGRVLA